ncbi:protein ITPRID2 [Osmerus eperlanus]|uniref:protein ITPRID2 n=1 Tax=Osmerus eperlanus TaxID=29151 RepID=UPI002E15C265
MEQSETAASRAVPTEPAGLGLDQGRLGLESGTQAVDQGGQGKEPGGQGLDLDMDQGGPGMEPGAQVETAGQEEASQGHCRAQHPWRVACLKRKAWAQSRGSWQESESQDEEPESSLPPPPPLPTPSGPPQAVNGEKPAPADDTGRIPNKIACWLKDCRTPLGASLDDQSSSPSKGGLRNGCSFEDDLSLGAEGELHTRAHTHTLIYLLSSGRFRQIEVLTTVANEFFTLYSQVSGQPVQKIGSRDGETPAPLKKSNSALNVAKLLKKSLSKPNVLSSSQTADGTPSNPSPPALQPPSPGPPEPLPCPDPGPGPGPADGCSTEADQRGEHKQKTFRKKDPPSLATVTEESNGSSLEPPLSLEELGDAHTLSRTPAPTGEKPGGGGREGGGDLEGEDQPVLWADQERQQDKVKTLTTDKLLHPGLLQGEHHPGLLPNPHIAHLRTQTKDSFEMEEVQSNEDEALPGTRSTSRAGSDQFLRTASQHSDSSGFAEDPSTDNSACYLKVQESTDSCDSETTVTSHAGEVTTPLAQDHPAFARLQGSEGEESEAGQHVDQEEIPQYTVHQIPKRPARGTDQEQQSSPEEEPAPAPDLLHPQPLPAPDLQAQAQTQPQPAPGPPSAPHPVPEEAGQEEVEEEVEDSSRLGSEASVHMALIRAQQRACSVWEEAEAQGRRVELQPRNLLRGRGRGRGRGLLRAPMQRSSSLPTSLLSPSKVVSSVKIQFGRGALTCCTPPAYSYHFNHQEDEEEEERKDDDQSSCRSTLIINPAPAEVDQSPAVPYPRPIPSHLTRSTQSLHSSSPPPDWFVKPLGDHAHSWSTWSVPNLSQPSPRPHPTHAHLDPHLSNPHLSNPHRPYSHPAHLPHPSPSLAQYTHPHSLYPSPSLPYGSAPNLLQQQASSPYPPAPSPYPPAPSPYPPAPSHHHPPPSHLHGFPYSPQPPPGSYYPPYHTPPPGYPYGSPYYGYPTNPYGHSLDMSYSLPAPHSAGPYSSLYRGQQFAPSPFSYPSSLFAGPSPQQAPPTGPSSTEMQLRRVLHDIRGTVHSLAQTSAELRSDTSSEVFPAHAPSLARGSSGLDLHQASLLELQGKRKTLNVFRTQMMDLELGLIRQQALVYPHLDQHERQEAEQLERLRSAVRRELQELDLQLEERLLALNEQTRSSQLCSLYRHPLSIQRGHSVDTLSNHSALRAMEPMSDLLREQLYLQTELGYEGGASRGATPSSGRSSRSASPLRGSALTPEPGQPQKTGVYRASVTITPATPQRPSSHAPQAARDTHTHPTEEELGPGEGGERPSGEKKSEEGRQETPQLQQLIKEIRHSLADEIRQEILHELLSAVSPQRSPVATREYPL